MPHHAAKAGGDRPRVSPTLSVRARRAVASVQQSEIMVVAFGVRALCARAKRIRSDVNEIQWEDYQ